MSKRTTIWWVRRDLRLRDNEALSAAAAQGGIVIPVFIHDAVVQSTGAAARWRWGLGLGELARALADKGSRLILRRGDPRVILPALARELGADEITWNRLYDPDCIARDTEMKSLLKADGIGVTSHRGHLLFEPWDVETQKGDFYKVYSPMWRAVKDREVATELPVLHSIAAPDSWPDSDRLADWNMGADMQRGAAVVEAYACVGEHAARLRLDRFIRSAVEDYRQSRDYPARDATSRLSENLTYGEIAPRRLWHAGQKAAADGAAGAEHFLKELVWREFAYHLLYHRPDLPERNFRAEWDRFDWRPDTADAQAWRQGRTGVEMVDAAMRELYVTGTMHNRARMIVGSYLTKHLLTDWRVGLRWFAETLIDWDPASNALGWQWIAGSGPDAAPYFRVFNPETQGEKFDGDRRYRDLFLAGDRDRDGRCPTEDFYRAIPRSWGLSPGDDPPRALIALQDGRKRALDAYEALKN